MIRKAISLGLLAGALLVLFSFWGGLTPVKSVQAAGVPYSTGDVFVGVGKGKI